MPAIHNLSSSIQIYSSMDFRNNRSFAASDDLDAVSESLSELLDQIAVWGKEAEAEGITLAQYALRWVLRRPEVTSVIVGASSAAQLKSNLAAIK